MKDIALALLPAVTAAPAPVVPAPLRAPNLVVPVPLRAPNPTQPTLYRPGWTTLPATSSSLISTVAQTPDELPQHVNNKPFRRSSYGRPPPTCISKVCLVFTHVSPNIKTVR
uniref:Uncharacterized protein n=1 Tax=Cacopsylla melanoneura TaxID=428564 RepID=A0A8D8LSY3_9HEMI